MPPARALLMAGMVTVKSPNGRYRLRWFAWGLASLALGCSGVHDDSEAGNLGAHEDTLIGGHEASEGEFPGNVWLGFCTGTKVAPRRILTAGHCVMQAGGGFAPWGAPGAALRITNSVRVDEGAYWRDTVIQDVHVFDAYAQGCKSGDCITPVHDAPHVPDVAIIDINVDTPDIPIVRVDLNPVPLGDPVTLLGYGCEAHDLAPDPYRLKLQNTTVNGKDSLETERRATAVGSYVITNALNRDPNSATLCPGDSGGPLYRAVNGEPLVVGINALVRGDEDNWDTRLDVDAAYDVAGWLRGFGLQLREPESSPRPFAGVAKDIPGTLQAEDYDRGPRGVAYADSDRFNQPFVDYRSEGVDIDVTQDQDGGFNIGGIEPGEWLSFAVNVLSDGEYDVAVRAASPADQSKLHIELDGQPVSGSIVLPNTRSYQQFLTSMASRVPLKAGPHSLRLVFETSGFNLNWVSFTRSISCVDGVKNGAEIDVDCGGICGACSAGKSCTAPTDCQSGSCLAGLCQSASGTIGNSAAGGSIGFGGSSNTGGATATGGLPALAGDSGSAAGVAGGGGSSLLAPQAKPTTPNAGCSVSTGSRPLGGASGAFFALALGAVVARSRRRRSA